MNRDLRPTPDSRWPHPQDGHDALEALMPDHFQMDGVDPEERINWYRLRSIVGAYDHLLRHPAGTEATVKKLRVLRRLVRNPTSKEKSDG